MGIFFTAGETKVRPGIYQRYRNLSPSMVAGAINGIVAATYQSNWGALGEVTTIDMEDADRLSLLLGNGGAKNTVGIIKEAFNGGAVTVLAVRLGTGGTNGTATLKDTASSPEDAITLTTKHPGSRALSYIIREKLGDDTAREFLVVEGDTVREKLEFAASTTGEADALIAAINDGSAFFTAEKESSYLGTGKLALVASADITPGTDPTVTNEDYSNAFVLLEPYRFNTLCVDTEDASVHAMLAAYIDRVYKGGKLECFGVVGEASTVAFDTRCSHAASFNNYNMVYVGSDGKNGDGSKLAGAFSAARIAGMVAAVPSNQSLTHSPVAGIVEPVEKLTDSQYQKAIKSGMLVFSTSAGGTVWVESAVTTLVNPAGEDDEGWKKIKRTKIRKELMARCSDSVEPLIGKVNNNTDGQANVIKIIKGVLKTMIAEEKLLDGATVSLDAANPPVGDSAWFNINADDVDSIEKGYFTYGFRFAAAAA